MVVKTRVVVFTDWFAPGYKAGGPIRSVVNFVETLEKNLSLYIVTADTDLGEKKPYPTIKSNQWVNYANNYTSIIYLSKNRRTLNFFMKIIKEKQPDFIYLNSMFSLKFTVFPLLVNFSTFSPTTKIILSPRGMLRKSALAIKYTKKKVFLSIFKFMRWHRKIHFHATDTQEKKDIFNIFGLSSEVIQIPNLPLSVPVQVRFIEKKRDELRLIFVGRIHPIKNLDFLLSILKSTNYKISLSIVGNIEATFYWKKCKRIIDSLPKNVKIHFIGSIVNKKVQMELRKNHFFILPTSGENFGHAIFEAFALGLPVIISDQTPWRHLYEKNLGWDISLHQPEQFTKAIETAAQMNQEEYNIWSASAWQFAKNYVKNADLKTKYLKLFS